MTSAMRLTLSSILSLVASKKGEVLLVVADTVPALLLAAPSQ